MSWRRLNLVALVLAASSLWILMASVAPVQPALAQEEEVRLRLNRDFGYSSLTGGAIQGTFTVKADGPDDLERVTFLMDGVEMGEDVEAPFQLQFHTGAYELGGHALQAVAISSGGRRYESNIVEREFVDPSEGVQSAVRIAGPILLIVLIAVVVPATISIISARRNPVPLGAVRKYGWFGGAICTNCNRPFSIHFWSLRLGVGRFDRCPHCGKWHFVRRAGKDELAAAEKAELAGEQLLPTTESEDERLRRQLDDSRFDDSV